MNPTSSLHLPVTLIDAVIPGYSFLAQVLLDLGIDISVIVSFIAFVGCAWTALRFAFTPISVLILESLSSSVTVEEWDPIFKDMLNWVAANRRLQNIRLLRASSPRHYDDDFDDANLGDEHNLRSHEKHVEDIIFNFNDWAARAPPKFQPHRSSGFFWHKRRIFRITRNKERVASDWSLAVHEREWLTILVLALSAQPVKDLIEEAREYHLRQLTSTTIIQRPTPKAQRGRRNVWTTVATRPSRSMATVVLESSQKAAILKDINDFLHPRTARWYSNRGIPYRRGYLFHGPPGTGKTSLSFALAGVFGLDIYCLALSEISLSEEDLILLFNSLPKRCILLLEDIDSAGVTGKLRPEAEQDTDISELHIVEKNGNASKPRPNKEKSKKKSKKSKHSKSRGDIHLKAVSKPNTITLSGLLNAIDGVASQEGRVLILTTNHPEKLNEALVRPGRVDLQIKFDLANKQQIKDLFLRMYCPDPRDVTQHPTRISQILPTQAETVNPWETLHDSKPKSTPFATVSLAQVPPLTQSSDIQAPLKPSTPTIPPLSTPSPEAKDFSDISTLANSFATALPELTFSPAEIQGFLLIRKNDPQQAVLEVSEWRDSELAKKAGKTSETGDRSKDQAEASGVSAESPSSIRVEDKIEREAPKAGAAPAISLGVADPVYEATESDSPTKANASNDAEQHEEQYHGGGTSPSPHIPPSNTPKPAEACSETQVNTSNGITTNLHSNPANEASSHSAPDAPFEPPSPTSPARDENECDTSSGRSDSDSSSSSDSSDDGVGEEEEDEDGNDGGGAGGYDDDDDGDISDSSEIHNGPLFVDGSMTRVTMLDY
ncbi:hypothetical protein LTR84_012315 [Exophiala bonariae]|uniref:AAA+ ATPase domain-containing protein n=1 Tax=Exophiala bonariae TaxID=1690606 RepID=A0AAV9NIA9_9EURO|nr:hypothetical protein LTR84_012315 [Exophiala bonariae]